MNRANVTIKVPGKLMIAGEYAILSTGYPAIVIAVNRYVTIRIHSSECYQLYDLSSNLSEVTWRLNDDGRVLGLKGEKYSFIKAAIEIACQFLKEKEQVIIPFHLQIQNGLNDILSGKKYGLGSSAAIVVGVISAILAFHDQDPEKEKLVLYKLACLAHLKCQGNGSGADIAAAIYGGWLCYYRYDLAWLIHKIKDEKVSLVKLVSSIWPNLCIEKIIPPANLSLLVGWTKHSVKTSPLVERIEAFQKRETKLYEGFLELSKAATLEFVKACELKEEAGILDAVHLNRIALQVLSNISQIQLETKEIKTLCDIADRYGKSKFSGAGVGDCGIAFLREGNKSKDLEEEWKQAGIVPLDLEISEGGLIKIN